MGVKWFPIILQAIIWASLLFTHIDSCGPIFPNVSHAIPIDLPTTVEVGTGVKYKCVTGYRAVSGSAAAICKQENGTNFWISPTLKCELEGCGPLLELHNQVPADITGGVREPPFPIGTNVRYQCDRGYVSEGGSTDSACILKDGKAVWDPPTLTCRGVSCGDSKLVNNADRLGHVFTFPNHVEYVCHVGYETEDPVQRYCQPNGDWSHDLPTCKVIHCQPLENPEKGSVDARDTSFKSFARYRCDDGYRLNGMRERECTKDKVWSGTAPNCTEVSCPPIDEIPNGQVTKLSSGKTGVGSIIFFKCHFPDTSTKYTSKCSDSGDWNPPPPICKAPVTTTTTVQPTQVVTEKQAKEKVQCGNPGNISHGISSDYNETLPENSNITYTCLPGYKLKGQATLICTSHGRWSPGIVPACDKPLTVEVIVGIVLGVVAFIIILVSGSLYCYRWRKRKLIHRNKACIIDAKDCDEIRTLERDKKYIPVTSL